MSEVSRYPLTSLDQDWGAHPSDLLPVSGAEVQRFIKEYLQYALDAKSALSRTYGYFRIVGTKIQFFANEEDAEAYDGGDTEKLLREEELPATGSGSSLYYRLNIANGLSGWSFYASAGRPALIKFTFTSKVSQDGGVSYEDTNERGVVKISVKKPSDSTYVEAQTLYIPSNILQAIDVSSFLGSGSNQVKVEVVGEDTGQSALARVYTVTVTSLSLSASTFDWATPFFGNITVPFYVSGAIQKTLTISISGDNYTQTYTQALGTIGYTEIPYTFTIPHPGAGGIYTIEASVENADGSLVVSIPPIQIICVVEGDTGKYIAINNVVEDLSNWVDNSVFDYSLYDAGATTTSIVFSIEKSGEVISTLALDAVPTGSKQHLNLSLKVSTETNDDFFVTITSEGLLEGIALPVSNEFNYAPTPGAVFQMVADNRSNSESNRAVIINEITGEEVETEMTNMNWSNDGWQSAEDGKVLRLQAGSKLTIGIQPLADMTQYSKGKTIELDFRCSNVLNYETPIIAIQDAVANNNASLMVYPDMSVLTSQLKFTDKEQENQSTKFEDGVRLRMTIVILPTAYGNQGFNLARIYVNNNCVREFTFTSDDKFLSTGNLVLGSEDADLDIYVIDIYNFALSRGAVETNFINFLATLAEKQATATRNGLFNAEGTAIDIDKVKQFCNVVVYERAAGNTLADIIPSITNQNESLLNVHFFFRDTPEENLVIRNYPMSGQGTSSMKYRFWNLRGKPTNKTIIEYADGSTSVKSFRWLGLEGIERLTDKINFASSPQSNKMGSVNSIVALTNYMGITADDNTPLAIIQRPFARFSLDTNEEGQKVYTFLGLGTIGPDKGDDGYMGVDEETKPNQLSLEGSDNAPLPTQFRVPWVAHYFRYNADEEAWQYQKNTTEWENCWDANEGDPNNTSAMAEFVTFYNFIYSCSPRLTYFEGTADGLNAQASTLKNVDTEYWLAGGDVYYYCPAEGKFIPSDCGSGAINLFAQLVDKGYGLTSQDVEGKSNEELTALFVKARCTKFGYEIGQYCNARSLYFSRNWSEFMAASDNRAKNTYYKKSRLFVDGGTWCAWFDDTDTIGMFTNQGQDRKGYWVEAGDTYEDGQPVFNADTSRLFLLLDAQIETVKNEMTAMMNAMVALSGSTKSLVADKLFDFFDKYYFAEAQEYFPDALYNETTRVVYEVSKLTPSYSNDTDPITQALGNYYSGWKRWIKKRIQYMMSKYSFGDYSANGTEFISVRASGTEIKYQITPAIWMYPNIASGTSIVRAGRTPAGETVEMTIDLGGASDQQNTIMGVHYLQSIGRWYNKRIHGAMTVAGRMLRELILGNEDATAEDWAINISSLELKQTPSLQLIDLRNIVSLAGTLDLAGCSHLRYVYAQGSSLAAITLPSGGGLRYLGYPATNQRVALRNFPLLTTDNVDVSACAPGVTAVWIENCEALRPVAMLADVLDAQAAEDGNHALRNVRVTGFEEVYDDAAEGTRILDALTALTEEGEYAGLTAEGVADEVTAPKPILQGSVTINASAYEDSINALRNFFGDVFKLTVTGASYIRFADPEVLRVLLEKITTDDGIGLTKEDVEGVTSIVKPNNFSWFQKNIEITTFNEFRLFTGITKLEGNTNHAAFRGCVNLAEITLPDTITEIGYMSFYECSALKTKLPTSITSVGGRAFMNSGLDGDLFLPNLTGKIDREGTFQNTKITSIRSLGKITEIGGWSSANLGAFYNCTLLKCAVLPETLTNIGDVSFKNCTSLRECNIPQGVTYIGPQAFNGCTALEIEELNLPNLTSLGQNAFYGVKIKKISDLGKITTLPTASSSTQNFGDKSVLEEVVLPSSVTTIPAYSFSSYSGLSSVNLSNVSTLGMEVFQGAGITSVSAPNLTSIGRDCFINSKLTHVLSLGNITEFPSSLSGNYGMFRNCPLTSVRLPECLEVISSYSFTGVSSVLSMNLPQSLKKVYSLPKGSWADGLTVSIPNLEDIGTEPLFAELGVRRVENLGSVSILSLDYGNTSVQGAFRSCKLLEFVRLPQTITRIGVSTFRGCSSLETLIIESVAPPLLLNEALGYTLSTLTIYVPDASVDEYKAATNWVTYAAQIEGYTEVDALPSSAAEGACYKLGDEFYVYKSDEFVKL